MTENGRYLVTVRIEEKVPTGKLYELLDNLGNIKGFKFLVISESIIDN